MHVQTRGSAFFRYTSKVVLVWKGEIRAREESAASRTSNRSGGTNASINACVCWSQNVWMPASTSIFTTSWTISAILATDWHPIQQSTSNFHSVPAEASAVLKVNRKEEHGRQYIEPGNAQLPLENPKPLPKTVVCVLCAHAHCRRDRQRTLRLARILRL